MSAGVEAFGSTIAVGDAADHATSMTFTKIAEVSNIELTGIEAEDIDVTHLESPDAHMEFIAGLVDAGEVDLELNYTPAEAANLYGLIRTSRGFEITWSDGAKWQLDGYIKSLGQSATNGEEIQQTATVKISGKPGFVEPV